MKITFYIFAFLSVFILFAPRISQAAALEQRLSGRILLQVQEHGEAWYVYPVNLQRYYLGRPADAFEIMSNLSMGINNRDFDSFRGRAPRRLAGYILLKVEDLGEAYYVNPVDLSLHFLARPADAFNIMRSFGLGIANADIVRLPVSGASKIPPGGVMNIVVTAPVQDRAAGLPLAVRGQARVFENTVNIRLKERSGRILVEDVTTAQAPDIGQFGPFFEDLSYPEPSGNEGVLEVFSISPRDGSEINKVIISLIFQGVAFSQVSVFFSNSVFDPRFLNCGTTYPVVRRVPATLAIGTAALNELLKGPTVTERRAGYFTNINEGTVLNSLNITGGTATADFNANLTTGAAGSCRVSAIRSQITSTLRQFPTVSNVVISVNGQSSGILQP